jgi:hypothetical protein
MEGQFSLKPHVCMPRSIYLINVLVVVGCIVGRGCNSAESWKIVQDEMPKNKESVRQRPRRNTDWDDGR